MIYEEKIHAQLLEFRKTKSAQERFERFKAIILMIKSDLKQEEAFYHKSTIPGLKTHISLHEEFVRDLYSMEDQFFVNGKIKTGDMDKICQYIPLWISQHKFNQDLFADCCMRINDIAVAA